MERFYVKAGSINAVRRALGRAPGGARVVGRFDRETIECRHTMDAHSFSRHWPVLLSRIEKAGLTVVDRPGREAKRLSEFDGFPILGTEDKPSTAGDAENQAS